MLTNEIVRNLAVLPDGRFVVSAEKANGRGWIRRFHADGSLDGSFNHEDELIVPAFYLALQSDGRLLAQSNSRIVRLETNGAVDASFSITSGSSSFETQMAVGPDDSIYFGTRQGLRRRCPDGGCETPNFSATETGVPRVDSSGRIVLFSPDRIVRINADGTDDPTFAPVHSFGRYEQNFSNFAIDRQGGVIVVGKFTSLAGVPRSQLGRLNPTNTLQGIGLARGSFLADEGGPASFVVERTGDARESASVRYRISPVSGESGHFQAREGEITFAPMERTKIVPVTVTDDSVAAADEVLLIELTGLPENSIPRRLRGTLRMLDNDRVRDKFDLSFGSIAAPAYSPGLPEFEALAVQSDGKILAVEPGAVSDLIQRLLPSGDRDLSFSATSVRQRKLADVQPCSRTAKCSSRAVARWFV